MQRGVKGSFGRVCYEQFCYGEGFFDITQLQELDDPNLATEEVSRGSDCCFLWVELRESSEWPFFHYGKSANVVRKIYGFEDHHNK